MAARQKQSVHIDNLLRRIMVTDDYEDQLVFSRKYPTRRAMTGELDPPLGAPLAVNLKKIGVKSLYSHQADAVHLVRAGNDIVLATDTASGKSLCYNIPVLETAAADPKAKALYIFPTKALGQDQTRMLHELIRPGAAYDENKCFYSQKFDGKLLRFGTYDGDTPADDRSRLRREAQIILTNPDMLSLGILPNHGRFWTDFFKNLKYVVIDEIHTYRGVFGSHVANLMRRLDRVCANYGSRPRFICCSATIANPGEHAGRLTGRSVAEITHTGAPSAGRIFILWNPPLMKGTRDIRKSPLTESINLFAYCMESNMRTIVFARAKPTVEMLLRATREKLIGSELYDKIISYRGGYLPSERRAIERALAEGDLLGVACTNALELGVDIGSLDTAIINGYPGSIASVWQQAGRAGRRDKQALAFFVAYNEPLDQYFIRHPEYFLDQNVEQAIINPSNPYIMESHLKAAAAEMPLQRSEEKLFGENFLECVRELIRRGELAERRGGAYYIGKEYPAGRINLRTTTGERYAICRENGDMIGHMDASTAFIYLHPGAVYLHLGESYLVDKLDLERKTARVSKKQLNYYTRSLSMEQVTVDKTVGSKKIGRAPIHFGYLDVVSRVTQYKKVRSRDNAVIGREPLDLPEDRLWTQGFWIVMPLGVKTAVMREELDYLGGLHAVEHSMIAMLPLLAMCDRQDVGGLSTDGHPDTGGRATIFVHDAYDGGMGLSEVGYKRIPELLEKTLDLVRGCGCDDGCPSCIQSPKCGNMNEPLDKKAAILILKYLLGID